MAVFLQGMRRSGTTIWFDLLCRDPRYDAWYEPFGPAKRDRLGGGSGVQDVNFGARTRALRRRFCAESAGSGERLDPAFFNYGAPRDARLELEPDLPEPCRGYLRRILEGRDESLVKFVRMAAKIEALRKLAPGAKLIHVVRDPRSVASSQILTAERRAHPPGPDTFFARCGVGALWASRALSDALDESGAPLPERPTDVERVLAVWRHLMTLTHRAGGEAFGRDYLLVRHEDLLARTSDELERVFAFLERPLPADLPAWAAAHLSTPDPPVHADHPGWRRAFERVGLASALAQAGYPEPMGTMRSGSSGSGSGGAEGRA